MSEIDQKALEAAWEAYCPHLSGRPDKDRLALSIAAYEANRRATPKDASTQPVGEVEKLLEKMTVAFAEGVIWTRGQRDAYTNACRYLERAALATQATATQETK